VILPPLVFPAEGEGLVESTFSLGSAHFSILDIIYFLAKQATLVRESTVLSLPFLLVFPGSNLSYTSSYLHFTILHEILLNITYS
jgi:hypothetical protein